MFCELLTNYAQLHQHMHSMPMCLESIVHMLLCSMMPCLPRISTLLHAALHI